MKNLKFVLLICLVIACSTKQPDLKMKDVSINKIEEIEKLNNFMLADFSNLLESCKQHTACWKYHGDKCYLPANSSLLHKYLSNIQAPEHLDYLTDNGLITGNINIRPDSTTRFQVKFDQVIRGDFDDYQDTVYHHEIVYHTSEKKVYKLGEYIIVKTRGIKPNWTYYITKQWVD